ncbi:hypothetical protein V6Z12_D05G049100 [Gossypium hirsutum]
MDRLRPRQRERLVFSGFTKAEIEKMEQLLVESTEPLQSKEFCQKIARSFSASSARAGKPIVKWTEVQSWFAARQKESTSKAPSFTDTPKDQSPIPETCPLHNGHQGSQNLKGMGGKIPDLSELKFEAKSSKDGAWKFVLDLWDLGLKMMNGLMLKRQYESDPSHLSILNVIR